MLKVVNKYGFSLVIGTFFFLPVMVYGQDLGSSNGLFRSPNPTAKSSPPTSTKKTTPKPKPAVAKTTTAKKVVSNKISSKVAKNSANSKSVVSKKTKSITPKNQAIKIPAPVNNVIVVGKPTGGTLAEFYEQAIEEGNTARDERNYVTAENAYTRARNMKADDSRAFYGLGNIFSDQQRWEEAENAYRRAIKLEPNSPEAHIAISFVLTQPVVGANLTDRYVEAEKMARQAIQIDAKNAVAYDQLGVSMELRGLIGAETQTAYRRAIELESNFALAYAHLGRLLRRNGLTNESAAAYRDAIRIANDIPTMILVADVMQSQQKYTESEQLLRRALRDDPKNPTALYLLGRALTTRGSYDEAEKVLRKSVEVSPNSFVSYTLLGSMYARRNNLDEAEKILVQALTVVSVNEKKRLSQEFEFVGDAFMKIGRNKDAVRVYQRALDLEGDKILLTSKLTKAQKG